jgi:heptosyltransferase II
MTIASSRAPQRILVRGVNWLGDAVMTTPALVRLREARPNDHITLLTPEKLADLWAGHPAINDVLSIPASSGSFGTAARVRAGKYDIAVLFPNSPRSALEVFFARVPVRIGFARPWRTWLLTQALSPDLHAIATQKRTVAQIKRLIRDQPDKPRDAYPKTAHQIIDYLDIVVALGADPTPLPPTVAVTDAEVTAVRQRFGAPQGKPLIGLNPGAEYGPAKRWPEDRFIAAARVVAQQTNCHFWIPGGPGDIELANRIAEKLPKGSAQSLAGQTSLRELCACLKACDLVLTNDTGPMHLAAALGTPVVVPFGSTSPELTGPGWPTGAGPEILRGQAPCAPCFRRVCPIDFRCMTSISIDTVVQAILRAVQQQGPLI